MTWPGESERGLGWPISLQIVLALVGEITSCAVPFLRPQAAFCELARAAVSTAWMIGS